MFGHFTTLCMKELTHFMSLASFCTPYILLYLLYTIFSGGIEKDQWYEMDPIPTAHVVNDSFSEKETQVFSL